MPIYEYRCKKCGTEFERRVKVFLPEQTCPECGSEDVKKLISRFGFSIAKVDKGKWLSGPKRNVK